MLKAEKLEHLGRLQANQRNLQTSLSTFSKIRQSCEAARKIA
jgi:hypothetical protein